MSPPGSGADRLQHALDLWLGHRAAPTCSDAELLSRHADLRDLLAPMLSDGVMADASRGDNASSPAPAEAEKDVARPVFFNEKVLGEGGMGTVYLARQEAPVRRLVALKVIKLGMDSARVLRRFEAERQALAMMEHDNIAKVYDAGTNERGQPWFAMEYVRGTPITRWCDDERLSIGERLELFVAVCQGVQHAHLKGVIHRDLKPSNVLVTVQNGRPVPKIIDFGLARAIGRGSAGAVTVPQAMADDGSLFTAPGQVVGTPEYMSPEQAGLGGDVDARSDVWSLGVLLYELLVGDLPFPIGALARAGFLQLQWALQRDATRPSTRVTKSSEPGRAAAALRGTDAHGLHRRLRGDLDWITLHALERQPERRYQSAAELAQDIQRHLHHEPVLACPPSLHYRLRKLMQRHRVAVVAGGAVLLALATGSIASTLFAFRAADNARLAHGEANEAKRQRNAAEANLAKFNLLANVVKLRRASADEATLWPPWPEVAPALRAWLANEAEPLAAELPALRTARDQMLARALPANGDTSSDEQGVRFAASADQFLYDTLAQLVTDLEAFTADGGPVARVRERADWAESVRRRSIDEHRAAWDDAAAAIAADPRFDGFVLPPQIGLVPLGVDPHSHLQEFYDLRSGDLDAPVPARCTDGRLPDVSEATGIVLVLLPGGTFWMGAQEGEGVPNAEPKTDPHEQPVHQVTLRPFFIGKYEMTQAQWRRLSGGDQPSAYKAGVKAGKLQPIGWANPVENVSWEQCDELVRRYGMVLPTEAQWEYACRAGTTTPWFTGSTAAGLAGYANVADATARAHAPGWGDYESFDDGCVVHTRVGSFLPNAFGLHDMHGNVWEWCRGPLASYAGGTHGDEGELEGGDDRARVMRGGGYDFAAAWARSASRSSNVKSVRTPTVGLRVARRVIDPRPASRLR